MQANINEFLARVPAESRRLLNRKSDLLNVLGNDVGSQIVVVGDTSSGKSSTMNFLFGFPINRESQGIGTRRPCVISMKPSPDREALAFRVTFHRAGCVDEALPDLDAVAAYVAEANDARRHPEWFPCLRDGYGMGPESAFDEEPIHLAIEHRDFMMAMRLVDLPGLTRRSELPMRIARSYIKPGNICLLIIGKDNPANGAFPKLAECMAKCSQNIFVQNFATEMRGSLEDNAEVLREEMRNAMGSEVRICLHCVDYGLPKTERNLQRRFWSDGKDQEDWWSIHQQQGPRQVQECMLAHEQRRAASLRECLEASQLSTAQFVPGLVGVLAKIFDFQTQSLPEVIADLEDQARAALAEEEEQVQEVRLEAKKLQNPPEWNTMLERAASVFREFLDATRAVGGAAPGDASEAGGAGRRALDDGRGAGGLRRLRGRGVLVRQGHGRAHPRGAGAPRRLPAPPPAAGPQELAPAAGRAHGRAGLRAHALHPAAPPPPGAGPHGRRQQRHHAPRTSWTPWRTSSRSWATSPGAGPCGPSWRTSASAS